MEVSFWWKENSCGRWHAQLEVHSTSEYFSSRHQQCVLRNRQKTACSNLTVMRKRHLKCLRNCISMSHMERPQWLHNKRDIWKCPRVSVGLHGGHVMWDCLHSCVTLQTFFQSDVMCWDNFGLDLELGTALDRLVDAFGWLCNHLVAVDRCLHEVWGCWLYHCWFCASPLDIVIGFVLRLSWTSDDST
jgi:hypothetical protein